MESERTNSDHLIMQMSNIKDVLETAAMGIWRMILKDGCKPRLKASDEMLKIFKMQHYNSMIVRDFPQYFLDSEDTGDEELITIASKSGSMNACRNDGGIVFTPYGPYVIVMFNKEFYDKLYYPNHDATVYGGRVSRLIFDQFMALKGTIK